MSIRYYLENMDGLASSEVLINMLESVPRLLAKSTSTPKKLAAYKYPPLKDKTRKGRIILCINTSLFTGKAASTKEEYIQAPYKINDASERRGCRRASVDNTVTDRESQVTIVDTVTVRGTVHRCDKSLRSTVGAFDSFAWKHRDTDMTIVQPVFAIYGEVKPRDIPKGEYTLMEEDLVRYMEGAKYKYLPYSKLIGGNIRTLEQEGGLDFLWRGEAPEAIVYRMCSEVVDCLTDTCSHTLWWECYWQFKDILLDLIRRLSIACRAIPEEWGQEPHGTVVLAKSLKNYSKARLDIPTEGMVYLMAATIHKEFPGLRCIVC